MMPRFGSSKSKATLVLDTSVVINLSACGSGPRVLAALDREVVVVNHVLNELHPDHPKGHHTEFMAVAISRKLLEIVALGEVGLSHFENLTVGSGPDTLDDGEAATVAYAIQVGAKAVIDDRKAIRICREHPCRPRFASTIDLFRHPNVERDLGMAALGEAVFRALTIARMRVLHNDLEWVVKLIGTDRIAHCPSLPAAVRSKCCGESEKNQPAGA